jgi:hypothetical protein
MATRFEVLFSEMTSLTERKEHFTCRNGLGYAQEHWYKQSLADMLVIINSKHRLAPPNLHWTTKKPVIHKRERQTAQLTGDYPRLPIYTPPLPDVIYL